MGANTFRRTRFSEVNLRIHEAARYYKTVVPMIGLIIGFYILTRMVQILGTKGERSMSRAMAIVTILVTLFGILDLLISGMPQSGLPY